MSETTPTRKDAVRKRAKTRRFREAIAVAIAVFALTGGLIVYVFYLDPTSQLPFDSEVWKNSEADLTHNSTRIRMADSLVDEHLTPGMTREQLIELLGPPDKTTDIFNGQFMSYLLGRERSRFALDKEWLFVSLDNDYRATGFSMGSE